MQKQDKNANKIKSLVNLKLSSLRASANVAKGFEAIPEWLCANTSDPRNPKKPWSFKHHEYQIQIMADPSPDLAVRKSSQTGLSEASVRLSLAMAVLYQGTNILYLLPTTGFSNKFSASRVAPVIKNSVALSAMLNRDVDSVSLRQLGNSFFHMQGTQTEIISIPCLAVVLDERDFMGAMATTARSRLSHNREGEGRYMEFSTPTLPDYGVDPAFQKGKKFIYMVKHDICGEWVDANPSEQIRIPGFEGTLMNWDRSFFADETLQTEKAWVECPHCKKAISQANLIDSDKRQWVAKSPDAQMSSYQVYPTDCAYDNSLKKIVAASMTYARTADYLNFALGVAVDDPESHVIVEALPKHAHKHAISPESASMMASSELGVTAIGMDVGKVCHLVVVRVESKTKYSILHMERIPQAQAADVFSERLKQYKCRKAVVDAMPDATLSRRCVEEAYHGQAYASFFVRNPPKTSEEFATDDEEGVIKVPRTHVISALVKALNNGRVSLPLAHPEWVEYTQHLKKLRKTMRTSDITGEQSEVWVSSDATDHYFFATVYAYSAARLLDPTTQHIVIPAASNIVTKAKQGEAKKPYRMLRQYPY